MICLNPIGVPGGGQSVLGYLFWFPELGLVTDIILICQAPARAVGSCGQLCRGHSFKAVPETDNSIWRADSSGGLVAGGWGWGSTLPIKLINLLSPLHRLRSAF